MLSVVYSSALYSLDIRFMGYLLVPVPILFHKQNKVKTYKETHFLCNYAEHSKTTTLALIITIMRYLDLTFVLNPNHKEELPPRLHFGLSVGGGTL